MNSPQALVRLSGEIVDGNGNRLCRVSGKIDGHDGTFAVPFGILIETVEDWTYGVVSPEFGFIRTLGVFHDPAAGRRHFHFRVEDSRCSARERGDN
jgi:hypothetical protein